MCGIMGIIGHKEVVGGLYDGLINLQHRGQDTAGIVTYNRQFHIKKGKGLVRDVFDEKNTARLVGNIGIGHVRYPTAGGGMKEDAQPFMVNSPYGIALAHNGNIFNYKELKEKLFKDDLRHVNSDCDAEVILNVFASSLSAQKRKKGNFEEKVFNAVGEVFKRVKGGYSVVALIAGKGMIAFRDPWGIKPLVWGERKGDFRSEYIFASENTMFNSLNFESLGDVKPGEAIFVNNKAKVYKKEIAKKPHKPCIFEYVYFARPDAMLNKISVYKSRLRMGENLAKKIKPLLKKLKVDVVIPAPTTANTSALALAFDIGVKYREGLVLNRFIGRTFIMPGQKSRKKSVRNKLSPVDLEIKGKNVMIVDDSIVRGNTSRQIVDLVRQRGAKKVYFVSASPPLRYPCVYGIDMPSRQEFLANNLTLEQIRKSLNVDYLLYQTLDDLIEAVTRKGKHDIKQPCSACFDGKYPTGDVGEEVLQNAEQERKVDKKH
jgi:amidophosphoribosyltransferase